MLLPGMSVLRVSNPCGYLGNIKGSGFTLFSVVQHGVPYGGSDEEAANGHGSHGGGKLASLVQHFTRVVAWWPLGCFHACCSYLFRAHLGLQEWNSQCCQHFLERKHVPFFGGCMLLCVIAMRSLLGGGITTHGHGHGHRTKHSKHQNAIRSPTLLRAQTF
ncbi:hypothetical protein POUND7_011263 [Theobroma cacao]